MLTIRVVIILAGLAFAAAVSAQANQVSGNATETRPNILIAISDDHSWLHTSIAGSAFVKTPNLDSVARSGLNFANAYAASPGCAPSRAALLTGRHHWMLGPAGTHGSSFPVHYDTFVDLLEDAGYKVGFTGKGWGPGDWLGGGRDRNPAGIEYNDVKLDEAPKAEISTTDYAGNFARFLAERKGDEPFYFWYGAHEPHLRYAEEGHSDERMATVSVPSFLPDTPSSRSMLLDYADEIKHFDAHLGRMLAMLEAAGELDNTLIIVTADNGMPMPRAKANGYDYGIHVPLAMRLGRGEKGEQVIRAPVGFVDLSATILEAARIDVPGHFVGESLVSLLVGDVNEPDYDRAVFSGRERHSSSRYRNLSYPQRMMRRGDFLITWSAEPSRHPAGAPRSIVDGELGPPHGAYFDIDDSMIKRELIARRDDPYIGRFFHLAVDKRPEWQFFNVAEDPECLEDLSGDPAYRSLFAEYRRQLTETLKKTGDPRVLGNGEEWENYPRLRGPMRYFPGPCDLADCSHSDGELFADRNDNAFDPATIDAIGDKVADWQLANLHDLSYIRNLRDDFYNQRGWIQGALFIGMMNWASLPGNEKYDDALRGISEKNGWRLGDRLFHGDDHVVGQLYLHFYEQDRDADMIDHMVRQFNQILVVDPDNSLEFLGKSIRGAGWACQLRWCWCDALFMSPPTWIGLSLATGDDRYMEYGDKEFWATTDYLLDPEYKLFYRDSRFFTRKDDEGNKIFWARGNGWVYAGLVNILRILPEDHASYPRYMQLFKDMSATIAKIQQDDGLWRVSLLAKEKYSSPETSGSSFLTYGLAWGVNNGHLDAGEYGPVVERGWQALVSAVSDDGKLGWVQPVGSAPDSVFETDSHLYGVGAFLLAASEMMVWK